VLFSAFYSLLHPKPPQLPISWQEHGEWGVGSLSETTWPGEGGGGEGYYPILEMPCWSQVKLEDDTSNSYHTLATLLTTGFLHNLGLHTQVQIL
jgi:hypothetical protein